MMKLGKQSQKREESYLSDIVSSSLEQKERVSKHHYEKNIDGLPYIEACSDFIDWLEVIKNRSLKTVEQYSRHLEKFSEYLEEKNIDSFNFTVGEITLKLAE